MTSMGKENRSSHNAYLMSIQPVNKAAEHLINSTPILGRRKKEEAVNAYLIKNSKGGGGAITSSRKDWAEYYVIVHPM